MSQIRSLKVGGKLQMELYFFGSAGYYSYMGFWSNLGAEEAHHSWQKSSSELAAEYTKPLPEWLMS